MCKIGGSGQVYPTFEKSKVEKSENKSNQATEVKQNEAKGAATLLKDSKETGCFPGKEFSKADIKFDTGKPVPCIGLEIKKDDLPALKINLGKDPKPDTCWPLVGKDKEKFEPLKGNKGKDDETSVKVPDHVVKPGIEKPVPCIGLEIKKEIETLKGNKGKDDETSVKLPPGLKPEKIGTDKPVPCIGLEIKEKLEPLKKGEIDTNGKLPPGMKPEKMEPTICIFPPVGPKK